MRCIALAGVKDAWQELHDLAQLEVDSSKDAALLMAAVGFVILAKICWAIPKQKGNWLRGLPPFILFGSLLASFLLLLDYSEWKEGYATRGVVVVSELHSQYADRSQSSLGFDGAALPEFPATDKDCAGGLVALIERCRMVALRSEPHPEFGHHGSLRLYFQDRWWA